MRSLMGVKNPIKTNLANRIVEDKQYSLCVPAVQ